jgi:energy-coupling factor transporter transmembrane protein EcfT
MVAGALLMAVVAAFTAGSVVFLVFALVRSIRDERDPKRSVWREFGLGLILMILFFLTWFGQGIAQWQTYTDEQDEHNQPVEIGDFAAGFAQSTLENWQSEFLQLFSFVTLAALYIHKGSAESKDGEEKLEASLRRIEDHLGILPSDAPKKKGEQWKLPETPLKQQDKA